MNLIKIKTSDYYINIDYLVSIYSLVNESSNTTTYWVTMVNSTSPQEINEDAFNEIINSVETPVVEQTNE